jgi:hypothetical protein
VNSISLSGLDPLSRAIASGQPTAIHRKNASTIFLARPPMRFCSPGSGHVPQPVWEIIGHGIVAVSGYFRSWKMAIFTNQGLNGRFMEH